MYNIEINYISENEAFWLENKIKGLPNQNFDKVEFYRFDDEKLNINNLTLEQKDFLISDLVKHESFYVFNQSTQRYE